VRDPLVLLADALRAEGGLLAAALVASDAGDALASLAATGPRAAAAPGEYALVLAAVREGYLLHYDEGRTVRPDDPDLALLGGDRLYALGLSRLAQLGDVDAVRTLADLISRCAQARAEGDPAGAEAAWNAAAAAVGGQQGA
jgi:hypothetical protein